MRLERVLRALLGVLAPLALFPAARAAEPWWVRQIGAGASGGASEAAGVACPGGDVIVAGVVEGELYPGAPSGGGNDAWAARYARDGSREWITQLSSPGALDDFATVAAAVPGGGGPVYVAGFTAGALVEPKPGAPNAEDLFVARLSVADGSAVWVRQLGSNQTTHEPNGMVLDTRDGRDGVFVSLTAVGDAVFVDGLPSDGSDTVLLRMDASGEVAWQHVYREPVSQRTWQLAVHGPANALYACSEDSSPTPPSYRSAQLRRYDADTGDVEWERAVSSAPGGANVYGRGVAVTGDAVFLYGMSEGNVSRPAAVRDLFVARYTHEGDLVWLSQFGSAARDTARRAAFDAGAGVLYVTGETGGSMPGSARDAAGADDIFAGTVDPATGAFTLLWQVGTDGVERVLDSCVSPLGTLFVAGSTRGQFDPASPTGSGATVSDALFVRANAGRALGGLADGEVSSGEPAAVVAAVLVALVHVAVFVLSGGLRARAPRAAANGGGDAAAPQREASSGEPYSRAADNFVACVIHIQLLAVVVRHNADLARVRSFSAQSDAFLLNLHEESYVNLLVKAATLAAVRAAQHLLAGRSLRFACCVRAELRDWHFSPLKIAMLVPIAESAMALVAESGRGWAYVLAVLLLLASPFAAWAVHTVARRPELRGTVLPALPRGPRHSAPPPWRCCARRQKVGGGGGGRACGTASPHRACCSAERLDGTEADLRDLDSDVGEVLDLAEDGERARQFREAYLLFLAHPLRFQLGRAVAWPGRRLRSGVHGHVADRLEQLAAVAVAVPLDGTTQLALVTGVLASFGVAAALFFPRRAPHAQVDAVARSLLLFEMLLLVAYVRGGGDALVTMVAVSQCALILVTGAMRLVLRGPHPSDVAESFVGALRPADAAAKSSSSVDDVEISTAAPALRSADGNEWTMEMKDGVPFYHCAATSESTWEKPA